MISLARAHERLTTYGMIDRGGRKAIQHQTVFVKTMALSDEELVDTNPSGFQHHYLESLTKRDDFKDLVDIIADAYERNLPELKQFFEFPEFLDAFNAFAKTIQGDIPPVKSFQLELRPAQVFSHNLYHFVKEHENLKEIEERARSLLADYNLPGEMINLIFTNNSEINFKQLTHTLTILSLLLREAALDIGFVPGRSVGNLTSLTE